MKMPLIRAVTLAERHSGLDLGDIERADRRQQLSFIRASYRVLPFGEDEAEVFGVCFAACSENSDVSHDDGPWICRSLRRLRCTGYPYSPATRKTLPGSSA